jgi:hypothetical protein
MIGDCWSLVRRETTALMKESYFIIFFQNIFYIFKYFNIKNKILKIKNYFYIFLNKKYFKNSYATAPDSL